MTDGESDIDYIIVETVATVTQKMAIVRDHAAQTQS